MNIRQRRVLQAVAVAVGAMMVYPPFFLARTPTAASSFFYEWIFRGGYARVDVELLFAQFVAVGVIGGICYLLAADRH